MLLPRMRILFTVLLLALAGISRAADPVPSVIVERRMLDERIQLDGVIEAVQQSTVSAQTSGRVTALPYDVDDSVPAGALIVQLEDTEQQARLKQAEAVLAEAQAGLADARQQFNRSQSLHERRLIADQALDQARNLLNAADARFSKASAAVTEARQQLEYTRVTAPYGGILTQRHVELGETVTPGQPLLSGLSLEQLRVVVDLPQQYAAIIRDERQAQVSLSDGSTLKTGQMTFYPYADPTSHSFRLRMTLDEPGARLFPGMLVKVSLPVAQRDALWVPAASLLFRSELRAVLVLDDRERPRLRQVRVGTRHGDHVEILAGLEEGERIATNPLQLSGQPEPAPARESQP